jgi:putative SOS response-associated peptidase YedK
MAGLWQPDAAGGRFTMLTTTPNPSVSPYHHRMPFILRAEQLGAWLGDDWLQILANPDWTLLEKIQTQAELF